MYQKVIVAGYLGGDPEMRYMPDGRPVTNFSLATSRRYTDSSGQTHDETTWFRVAIWGRQAETANQYLSKGRPVIVEGRLRADPETGGPRLFTRQDGTVGASYELTAYNFSFIGGRDTDYQGDFDDSGSLKENQVEEEDDIPF
ncbi:MAG TPA: single-stranded DNA-binding protein [Candidatus Sulfomarinibacteraceae bacterium]|nr:single-stranded DNA-binding protein [Candidatus Sulfomarinibacteraceae bacterium]